ncbi:hypothetical protein E2P81_ATG11544 [Venturia nashicola]|nr:hypothetical protein E2P81_ATG11544 [Venturia nashicola]
MLVGEVKEHGGVGRVGIPRADQSESGKLYKLRMETSSRSIASLAIEIVGFGCRLPLSELDSQGDLDQQLQSKAPDMNANPPTHEKMEEDGVNHPGKLAQRVVQRENYIIFPYEQNGRKDY